MLRNVLTLFLAFSLSPNAQADYESVTAAYEAYKAGDYEIALEILIPLAEAGNATAQSGLGFMYLNGFGIPEDYVKGFAWIDIAAKGGLEQAQNMLGMVGAKLNPAQLKEAHKLAKELREKYGNKTNQ